MCTGTSHALHARARPQSKTAPKCEREALADAGLDIGRLGGSQEFAVTCGMCGPDRALA